MDMQTVTQPTISEAIGQVAMLARIACSTPGISRKDATASSEVDQAKGAKDKTTAVYVDRLMGAKEIHNQRVNIHKSAQVFLSDISLPWTGGWWLLPNAQFEKFVAYIYDAKEKDAALGRQLEAEVDRIVAETAQNIAQYTVAPLTREELLTGYSMEEHFAEVPTGRNPNIPAAAEEWVRQRVEDQTKAAYQQGLSEVAQGFVKPLTRIANRLEEFSFTKEKLDNGKVKKTTTGSFKNSLFEGIRELIENAEAANVLKDPTLTKLIEDLSFFRYVHPDDLRNDGMLRQAGATKAKELIGRLSAPLGI